MGERRSNYSYLPYIQVWNKEFLSRREISHQLENKPYVDVLRDTEAAAEGPTTSNSEPDDIIKLFTNLEDPFDYRSRKIRAFCTGFTTVGALEDCDTGSGRSEKVAFLIERDTKNQRRSHPWGYTAKELYSALVKKRFADHTGTSKKSTQPQEPDADQRLLYICNPDPRAILALAATASEAQALVLPRFIYEHLKFDASIHVDFPSTGISSFNLVFHLPFFAFRRSATLRKDMRTINGKSKGKSLRDAKDVTFLRRTFDESDVNSTEKDCIYECVVSCAVTGFDEHRWTATMFIDTFHEDPDEEGVPDIENMQEPDESAWGHHGPDLLTCGKFTLDQFIHEPREYFLHVMEPRFRQMTHESTLLFAEVEECCEKYREAIDTISDEDDTRQESDSTSQPAAGGLTSVQNDTRGNVQDKRDKPKKLSAWRSRTTALLRLLIQGLESTDDAWNTFSASKLHCFHSGEVNAYWNINEPGIKALHAIEDYIIELRCILKKMNHLQKELSEDIPTSIRLGRAIKKDENAQAQKNTADDLRDITWTNLFTLPCILVGTLLNMREGFLPVPASFVSFLIFFLATVFLISLIFDRLRRWKYCRKLVRYLKGLLTERMKGQRDVESFAGE
ncbi:hypothetical protein F5Y15DRAFT_113648 [Xylariaceae sp. FL0016]|nr:hypothetical protein F5Y15DRAFT_113648 [Xylariaceae sp. FL0016]